MSAAPVIASVKVRPTSGCFHREHSPNAFDLIDQEVAELRPDSDVSLVEHETGPEVLVDLAVATAALGAAKSLIDLVVAIIRARSDGVRRGDHPSDPIELIVRRSDGSVEEETILRIGPRDPIDRDEIARGLDAALGKLGQDGRA